MQVEIKFDFINHHFNLEFVDSGLFLVQDENNFIYPLSQAGVGSHKTFTIPDPTDKKSTDLTGSGSLSKKICTDNHI